MPPTRLTLMVKVPPSSAMLYSAASSWRSPGSSFSRILTRIDVWAPRPTPVPVGLLKVTTKLSSTSPNASSRIATVKVFSVVSPAGQLKVPAAAV